MATSSGPTLYRGDATPATGRTGDLWVNTTESPPVLHICLDDTPTWIELGGMKPSKVTEYTTGSGNHTIVDGTWVRVTCVGGGGGGGGKGGTGAAYAGGGGGGATVTKFYKVRGTSLSYSVGTAGVGGSTVGSDGTAGGTTVFDVVAAAGGYGGDGQTSGNGGISYGGGFSVYSSNVDTSIGSYSIIAGSGAYVADGMTPGGGGGAGNSSTNLARYAGFPDSGQAGGAYGGSMSGKGGSGGCSLYGFGAIGSVDVNADTGTGYGAGGAGAASTTGSDYTGGNGTGGLIIVEEFGVW